MEIKAPIGTRVDSLEKEMKQAIQKLNQAVEDVDLIKSTLNNMATDLVELISRSERASKSFSALDGILEDLQIRHVGLQDAVLAGNVTEESLDQATVAVRSLLLKTKVDALVEQKLLEPDTEISKGSFIVFSEFKDDGKKTTPRAQYGYQTLLEKIGEDKAKVFLGKKVGETFKTDDTDNNVCIDEIYKNVGL